MDSKKMSKWGVLSSYTGIGYVREGLGKVKKIMSTELKRGQHKKIILYINIIKN